MRIAAVLLACLAVTACSDIPRDPEGTTRLVRESRTIRLGIAEDAARDAQFARVVGAIEAATGAKAQAFAGDSEALLSDLRDGRIDLVYGVYAEASPWAEEVHLSPPPGWRATPPDEVEAPRFAMRNGENGWIMLVEQAIER